MLLQQRFDTPLIENTLIDNDVVLDESDIKEFNKYKIEDYLSWGEERREIFELKDLKKKNNDLYQKIVKLFSSPKLEEMIESIRKLINNKIIYGKENYKQQIENIKDKIMEKYGESDKYLEYIDQLYSPDIETKVDDDYIRWFVFRRFAYDNRLNHYYNTENDQFYKKN